MVVTAQVSCGVRCEPIRNACHYNNYVNGLNWDSLYSVSKNEHFSLRVEMCVTYIIGLTGYTF